MTIIETLSQRTNCLKLEELATILSFGTDKLYRMAKKGTIPFFRVGTSYRFDPAEIVVWLQKRTSA